MTGTIRFKAKAHFLSLWQSLNTLLRLSPSCLFLRSQRFGRHPVLILSVLFMLVFGLSVAFSVNVTMFSTLRFFEGFCLAGLALSLYVLSKYMLSAWLFPLFPHSSISLFVLGCVCVYWINSLTPDWYSMGSLVETYIGKQWIVLRKSFSHIYSLFSANNSNTGPCKQTRTDAVTPSLHMQRFHREYCHRTVVFYKGIFWGGYTFYLRLRNVQSFNHKCSVFVRSIFILIEGAWRTFKTMQVRFELNRLRIAKCWCALGFYMHLQH